MDATLVLVHKKPELGVGKQRLATRFGTALTLQIAQALLACAFEDAADWPGPVVLAPANQNDECWARSCAKRFSSQCKVVPQISGNLGQRLNVLDDTLRREKEKLMRLVYIGSDSPGLKKEDYMTVKAGLHENKAVLIPATDGGVVLMANRSRWPDLSNLPWSTDQLGAALSKLCQIEMGSVKKLRKGYDIDEPEDFFRLIDTLKDDQRPARRALCALASDVALTLKISHNNMHA
ncbi:MAG: hypothetical protein NMNS02_29660 [Nitrosomonas sp.]|nr:MAG: hypothetical protein NMNS02_29660 [Nitrosomonas sp.]